MNKSKRIIICLLSVLLILLVSGCENNKTVTKVIPQDQKQEFFKDFEAEKKFMLKEAFKAVKKAGETPKAWYKDKANFTKGNRYSAYSGYIECESGKLAHVHVQFKMEDTAEMHKQLQAMSDAEIAKIPSATISNVVQYKAVPKVYSSNASIRDNFFRH